MVLFGGLKGFSLSIETLLKIVLGLVFASAFLIAVLGYFDTGVEQAEGLLELMDGVEDAGDD